MIIIDHINIKMEELLLMETEWSNKNCCWEVYEGSWSRSIITTTMETLVFLSLHMMIK